MKTYLTSLIALIAINSLSNAAPACCPSEAVDPNAPQTFARFVPERNDDFAWENDKIAFRAYGPAGRKGVENSGFDAWLKRVDTPIINKWYAQNAAGKSYHTDHGEGLDNYKVGDSAGVGGTGIWVDGKREPLEAFTEYKVIEVTPKRSQFQLTYENEVNGVLYGEVKTITIELRNRLFQVDSTFTKDGKPAANLDICIGLTLQNGQSTPFSDKDAGWIATWGSHDDSELGTGVKMNPSRINKVIVTESSNKKKNHIFIITQTDAQGKLSYEAGYGWKKAGEITSKAAWQTYLGQ